MATQSAAKLMAPASGSTASPQSSIGRTYSQTRLPFVQPTPNFTVKSNASSSDKGRSKTVPPPATSSLDAPSKLGSSLTTLSTALEKLNLPPPSRPGSSLGFSSVDSAEKPPAAETGTGSATGPEVQPQFRRKSGLFAGLGRGAPPLLSMNKPGTAANIKPMSHASARPLATPSSSRIGLMGPPSQVPPSNGKPRAPKIFGVGLHGVASGRRAGIGVGLNRVGLKASRQTTLQTVVGSPVKGGAQSDPDLPEGGIQDAQLPLASGSTGAAPSADTADSAGVWTDVETDHDIDPHESPSQDELSFDSKGKAKEHATDTWKHKASRRASLASQFLSESLSELPSTPESSSAVQTSKSPKRYHSVGLRSASRGPNGTRGGQSSPQIRSTTGNSKADASGASGPGAARPGALTVLKDCSIFVDVRTDDGDDAGSLFVDMLRGMGARVRRVSVLHSRLIAEHTRM